MHDPKHILIAVDDSEASYRAVTYVGSIIGARQGFHVCLLHALPPLPRELLEFGGTSNPQEEERQEANLRQEQRHWIDAAEHAAEPVFTRAKSLLRAARVPARAIDTVWADTINQQDLILGIIETARKRNCGTVVVGRESFHGLHKLLAHHVADALIRQNLQLTVWVVE